MSHLCLNGKAPKSIFFFFFLKWVDFHHSTTITNINNRHNTSARKFICIHISESEAGKTHSPGVCQEQECVSTSMWGFTDWLRASVAAPPHQDKAQLKEVQWKTTKGCSDLWGELNLWTSTEWRGGGMCHQGFFLHLFIYLQDWKGDANVARKQRKVWRHGERVRPTTKHAACCVSSSGSLLCFQNRG